VDGLGLRHARRHGAGHPDGGPWRHGFEAAHEVLRARRAPRLPDLEPEEQPGDRGGAALARERETRYRVAQGVGARRVLERPELVAVDLEDPPCRPGELARRQPVRGALDDERPAREREEEQLGRSPLGVDRVRPERHEVAERPRLRVLQRGQRQRHARRDSAPSQDDGDPGPDDRGGEAPHAPTFSAPGPFRSALSAG